jgi:hypothetical protein
LKSLQDLTLQKLTTLRVFAYGNGTGLRLIKASPKLKILDTSSDINSELVDAIMKLHRWKELTVNGSGLFRHNVQNPPFKLIKFTLKNSWDTDQSESNFSAFMLKMSSTLKLEPNEKITELKLSCTLTPALKVIISSLINLQELHVFCLNSEDFEWIVTNAKKLKILNVCCWTYRRDLETCTGMIEEEGLKIIYEDLKVSNPTVNQNIEIQIADIDQKLLCSETSKY